MRPRRSFSESRKGNQGESPKDSAQTMPQAPPIFDDDSPEESKREHLLQCASELPFVREATANVNATHCHLGDGPSKAFLEIFAGSARLTAACLDQGMLAYGIDHIRYKHARGPVISLDLTSLEHQEILLRWIASGVVGAVALAPPCGTASRAREIPGGPPPLRTDNYPDGLPGLSGISASRVASANSLYAFCARVVQAAEQQGLPWVIENPTNSLFWSTSFWASVASLEHIVADLQACAFGGSRPKWTRLVGNFTQLQALARSCPGCVAHAPWGRRVDGSWSTAEEAAYGFGLALSNGGKKDTLHFPFNRAIRENAQIQSKAKLPF